MTSTVRTAAFLAALLPCPGAEAMVMARTERAVPPAPAIATCGFRVARDLSLHFDHRLGTAVARQRVYARLQSLQAKFSGTLSSSSIVWTGNSSAIRVSVFGQQATAQVFVRDTSVDVLAHLPLVLSPLAGNIEAFLENAARETLH